MGGFLKGSRSSLFWEWIRTLEEMDYVRRPPVLCVENVVGFLVAENGKQFALAYQALKKLGYLAGALVIDAVHFVPQSRPRSFLVAIKEKLTIERDALTRQEPDSLYHTKAVMTAWKATDDPRWIWWRLPEPPLRKITLADVMEPSVQYDPPEITNRLLKMLSPLNQKKLKTALLTKIPLIGAGYKRSRWESGVKKQRLEIRFDGIAGCLRTPEGGSSRQIMIAVQDGKVRTRLLTVRETARLMGAPDSYEIPGSYNDGYRAMGDAVAVPVTQWITKNLLFNLAKSLSKTNGKNK
jgi:DNA (cytosine-5)-methyltransferase 1